VHQRLTRKLIGSVAAGVDRAVTRAVRAGPKPGAEELRQRTDAARSFSAASSHWDPEAFFLQPRTISPTFEVRGSRHLDVSWPSADQSSLGANQTVHLRLFTGETPRPTVVIVHGYMAGHYALEQKVWPIAWFQKQGLDVALFTLPHHGMRGTSAWLARPQFPSADLAQTHAGFRQAVADLQEAVGWLQARGHRQVGLLGMSLGGYTAALTATVDPSLDFLVLLVPLASLADFAVEQSRYQRGDRLSQYHAALEEAHRLISPLHRAPRVDPSRVLVVAGQADRITPPQHARRMARHFGSPLVAWPGGHLFQHGRGVAFERIAQLLQRLGTATPPH
jgi:pimeloyl-ACP methyl ester carboxylesterase